MAANQLRTINYKKESPLAIKYNEIISSYLENIKINKAKIHFDLGQDNIWHVIGFRDPIILFFQFSTIIEINHYTSHDTYRKKM